MSPSCWEPNGRHLPQGIRLSSLAVLLSPPQKVASAAHSPFSPLWGHVCTGERHMERHLRSLAFFRMLHPQLRFSQAPALVLRWSPYLWLSPQVAWSLPVASGRGLLADPVHSTPWPLAFPPAFASAASSAWSCLAGEDWACMLCCP